MIRQTASRGSWSLRCLAALFLVASGLTVGAACSPEERDFGSSGGSVCKPGATESCYSGPSETIDTGLCKPGTRTCLPDGSGFGACEGEVLPQTEDCLTIEDEACNGNEDAATCPPFKHVWSKTFGDPTTQAASGVAIDPKTGDIVVVGLFTGTLDFGVGPMAATGSADIYIAKLSPLGEAKWSKRFGDSNAQIPNAVVIDAQGMIYIGGELSGSVDFGDGMVKTSAGSRDAFVAKFDPDGGFVWSRLFGDASSQEITRLALASSDQVVAVGTFSGSIDLGKGEIQAAGSQDGFIVRLDSAGFIVNGRVIGGPGSEEIYGVDVDADDATILTGSFDQTLELDPTTTLTSAGLSDVFLTKISPAYAPIWAKGWGDAGAQSGFDARFTPNGDVLIAGTMEGAINFGGGDLVAPMGAQSLYLARLGGDGTVAWSKIFGGPASSSFGARFANDVVAKQIVVAGWFSDTIDFGGGPFVAQGQVDAFIARLDPNGDHVASRSYGGMGSDGIISLQLLPPTRDPILAGIHSSPVDFGGGPLTTTNTEDPNIFLARILP